MVWSDGGGGAMELTHLSSSSFMGGCLHSWAVVFVSGQLSFSIGSHLHEWSPSYVGAVWHWATGGWWL